MDNNLEEQFEEAIDNPIDPEDAVQLDDDLSQVVVEDVVSDDDATFGAIDPETPRREADGSLFHILNQDDTVDDRFLQNVTNRDDLARKAATLLKSVVKMDRALARKGKGLEDDDEADDEIENEINSEVDRLRTGRKVRINTSRRATDRSLYISNAVRQSIGAPSKSKWIDVTVPSPRATKESRPTLNIEDPDKVIFAGHQLTIKRKPLDLSQIEEVRQYDKTERHKMSPEGLQKFADRATGYVLGKRDKLAVPVINLTDDSAEKVMDEVINLSAKLTTLKTHMTRFDIGDVMEVLVPIDLTKSCALEETTFNVLDDYPILHPAQVANSISYLRLWVEDTYVTQNLAYTHQLIENNTDSKLWHKCLEQYDEFHEAQRGGPLMLLLILRQIQNTSDKALESLKAKLENLKITDIPGEDIDRVVSLIKSTDKILQTSSHGSRSYTLSDLAKTCVDIFLTCSYVEFTAPFEQIKNKVMAEADMAGTSPDWPTVTELTNMASFSYARNRQLVWNKAPTKSSAFNASSLTPHGPHQKARGNGQERKKFNCFNCDSEDHLANDCPLPPDERKIAAGRKAYMDKKNASGSGSSSRRSGTDRNQRRMSSGQPEIKNKNGFWVPDTKKLRELAQTTPPVASPPQTSQSPPSTPVGAQANVRFTPVPAETTDNTHPSFHRCDQLRSILRTSARQSVSD